ncbi:hypothetical protein O181_118480 [Austropuccinia psidii MF-1]|uniref:Retrotransposon gag domain-containing protein n=1 Tax=Austropuccinia psidii MF-1 TaxID=1389203 RepID=A0A9Q3PZF2_9BASI|nr:hypothetical protein [Austropuccinia psidii MF-1]
MLQEDFHIPDEIIVGKLHSLFTRTAKKWYYKMRMDHGKHDWSWWKSEVITKWANNSWRFKMENAFENAIFNSEKDKPLTWFFKQKDRLSALHPDMSDTMINMKILRKLVENWNMLSKAYVWNPVQQRTTLMQWKISLPGQELVKLGLKSLWNPRWSQRFLERTEDQKNLS